MQKEFDKAYNEILSGFYGLSGIDSNLIDSLEKLKEEYILLEQKDKDNQLNKKILRHELRGSLGNLGNVIEYIRKNYNMPEKELAEMLGFGEDNLTILKELVGLLNLEDSSLEEITKNSKEINLELVINRFWRSNSVRTINENSDKKIYNEIGISANYVRQSKDTPTKVYSNLTMTDIYLGIIFGNSLSYSLSETMINQQVIENGSNVKILIENSTHNGERQRDGGGLGKQLGIPYAKTLLEKLGGELIIYNNKTRINTLFHVQEKFGQDYKLENYPEFFGIQMNIPKNPLTSISKPENQ